MKGIQKIHKNLHPSFGASAGGGGAARFVALSEALKGQ